MRSKYINPNETLSPKAQKRSSPVDCPEAKPKSLAEIRAQGRDSISRTLRARSDSDQSALAAEIEQCLFDTYKEANQKYYTKLRSILFNLKDKTNHCLYSNVITRVYSPGQFVAMTTSQMASKELSDWRDKNTDNNMTEIKKMSQQRPVLKMTHKGAVPLGEEDMKVFNNPDEDIIKTNISASSDETISLQTVPEESSSFACELRELERLKRETEIMLNATELCPLREDESVWEGCMAMEEVLYCPVVVSQLPGCHFDVDEIFPPSLEICGRIRSQSAFDYIRTSLNSRRKLVVFQVMARSEGDGHKLEQFGQYLRKRDRLGVVKSVTEVVTDLYVSPYPCVDAQQLVEVFCGDSVGCPLVLFGILRGEAPPKVPRVLFSGGGNSPNYSPQ